MPEFGKIVVFGTGLIGGSFALALKEASAVGWGARRVQSTKPSGEGSPDATPRANRPPGRSRRWSVSGARRQPCGSLRNWA